MLPSFSNQCVVSRIGNNAVVQRDSVLMGAVLTENIVDAYCANRQDGTQTHVRTLLEQCIALAKDSFRAW